MTSGIRPGRGRIARDVHLRWPNRRLVATAFGIIVLSVATYANPSADARGAAPVKFLTVLELQIPNSVELGTHPQALVRLTSNGQPVVGELVALRLGARILKQAVTGADGTATADIALDLSAGTYTADATFAGTRTYQSSSSPTVSFTIQPVQLTIATVPAMPDVPLISVGGGPVQKTGADGIVRLSMTSVGKVELKMALPADSAVLGLRLARWDDGSTDSVHTIRIPDIRSVTVGIQILYPVRFAFNAANGERIDVADVPVLGIADGAGAEQTLSGPAPYLLKANTITRLPTGLSSQPIEYRVLSAQLGGTNVISRGQQRFVADRAKTVQLDLLVYYLTVRGQDALLKTPTGSTATITSDAGTHEVLTLDQAGQAMIRLPRGEYRIVLGGGSGIALSTPVALSRDQTVNALLISLQDIAMAIGVGLVLTFGLILVGRPHVLRRRKVVPLNDSVEPDQPDSTSLHGSA